MKAKCLISTVWYTLTFEAGKVYDIDEMLYPRLIRSGKFIPAKEDIPEEVEPEVEQPETPEKDDFKPVATFIEPLPETDDLAKEVSKPIIKPVVKRKPKGKRK
jgi:hypothetical protein